MLILPRENASSLELGFIFAAYPLAMLLAAPLVSGAASRMGRRKVLLLSLLVMVLSTAVFAAARGTAALLVARSLQGMLYQWHPCCSLS